MSIQNASPTFFFFSFGVIQLMLLEKPQPYDLLYYPRIGPSNILHRVLAATPPKQRKLELQASNFRCFQISPLVVFERS
jgi:hypothetical protein